MGKSLPLMAVGVESYDAFRSIGMDRFLLNTRRRFVASPSQQLQARRNRLSELENGLSKPD